MKTLKIVHLLLFTTLTIYAQIERKDLFITIYNNNLGVIKDSRIVELKKGFNELSFKDVAQYLEPSSVKLKFNGTVIEQNFRYDLVDFSKVLQKYVDKKIELIVDNGAIVEGNLLSSYGSQVVLQKNDKSIIMLPDINKYKINLPSLPEELITQPTLVWALEAEKSGKQDIQITYQTFGLSWNADYVITLKEQDTKADINAWVNITNNSGAAFKNAKLKLIAGEINRAERPTLRRDRLESVAMMSPKAAGNFEQQDVFEYKSYDLQRSTDINDKENKQISLFDAKDVKIQKKYAINTYQYNSITKGKVNVTINFENKDKNSLGIPFPYGKARIFESGEKNDDLVGEDFIDHTPEGEKITLNVGTAFDVLYEQKVLKERNITDKVRESESEITIKNRKDEDIIVEVTHSIGNNWEIIEKTHDFEQKDSSNILFKIPVKKKAEAKLKLKVRYTN